MILETVQGIFPVSREVGTACQQVLVLIGIQCSEASGAGAPDWPVLSSRMPATLPPFSSTSLGHLSVSPCARPLAATKGVEQGQRRHKDRSAARSGGPRIGQ